MNPTDFTPLPGPQPPLGALHTANPLVGAIAQAHYARSGQFEAAIHALQALGPDNDVASLARFRAALAKRGTVPFRMVMCGSSTVEGTYTSPTSERWVDKVAARLQGRWPRVAGGAEAPVLTVHHDTGALSAAAAAASGVQVVNAGKGGSTAWTYLDAAKVATIRDLAPQVIVHMVGSNDYAGGTSPADYRYYLTYWLGQIDEPQHPTVTVPWPPVHILTHQHARGDTLAPAHRWSEYGQVMREVAQERRYTLFLDMSLNGTYIGGPVDNHYGLWEADDTHLTNDGMTWLADLFYAKLVESAPLAEGDLLDAVPVTATPPAFVEAAGTASDAVHVPQQTGVTYRVNGVPQPAGPYSVTGDVEVTAHPASNAYQLLGATRWQKLFSSAGTAPARAESIYTSDEFTGAPDGTELRARRSDAALGGVPRQWYNTIGGGVPFTYITGGRAALASGYYTFTGIHTPSHTVSTTAKVAALPTGGDVVISHRRNTLDSATSQVRIFLKANGTVTWDIPGAANVSGTTGVGAWAAGDEIELWSIGSLHRVYRNGTQIMEANATLDTGNWAGIGTYGGSLSVDWVRITERTA